MTRPELIAKLDEARTAAEAHRSTWAALETRSADVKNRRDSVNAEIDALPLDAPDTKRAEIEAKIDEIKADEAALDQEIAEYNDEQARLDAAVTELEDELKAADEKSQRAEKKPVTKPEKTTRKEIGTMNKETRTLFPDLETRARFFEQDVVKNWVEEVRSLAKRNVQNGTVLIPIEVLDIIRPAIERASKLYKHVRVRRISGKARQPILADVPEAVWTEACGKLNELNIRFADVTLDGYKVGGYIPVCNALLEDSVINLGEEIMMLLAGSIAKALDKAILYGTGVKMPYGIAPSLALENDPEDPNTTVPFVDLHSTNIITIADTYTGASLYQQLTLASGAAEASNVERPMFAAMNRATWVWLKAQAVSFDAAGALRAELDGLLPIVGAEIEIIEAVPTYNIIMGYGEKYPLGERSEVDIGYSEHVMYIEDHTVFRGRARYDGRPADRKAFVVVGVNGVTPATTAAFEPDYANTAMNTLTVTAAAGSAVGKTVLTVSGAKAQSNPKFKYQIGDVRPNVGTAPVGTWTDLTSGSTAIEAAAGTVITVVELDANDKIVSRGDVRSVPKAS